MNEHVKYALNENGEFVIENYNSATPFSSFLPGIAGLCGRPVWCYYVNRGQCVSSFGINGRDNAILEFNGAAKAFSVTARNGFRTFLKVRRNDQILCFEPFGSNIENDKEEIIQRMYINSHDVRLEEIDSIHGMKTVVTYFTLPNEEFGGLVRKVTIENLSQLPSQIEVMDGLPEVIAYPIDERMIKILFNFAGTLMSVKNEEYVPLYKSIEASKSAGSNGYFYAGFDFDFKGKVNILKSIIDPEVVFGEVTGRSFPREFWSDGFKIPERQVDSGKIPSAFIYKNTQLMPGQSWEFYAISGYIHEYNTLRGFIETKLDSSYMKKKETENKKLINSIKGHAFTASSSREFNEYIKHTFLDNLLRGGYPIPMGKGKHIVYAFSRKHGDMEREYNRFQLDYTPYSQGNGNYRDMNQNRRDNVYFFPMVDDADIRYFMDLIQLDGFNAAFKMKTLVYQMEELEAGKRVIKEFIDDEDVQKVENELNKSFTPGTLLDFLTGSAIRLKKDNYNSFLDELMSISLYVQGTETNERFYADHWTYNTDLLEKYHSIYPDRMMKLLFEEGKCTYFDPIAVVMPRSKKYVFIEGKGVRQWEPVVILPEKEKMVNSRQIDPYRVRKDHGIGEVYYCSLISKLVCLLVNKAAMLDSSGVGLEMESGEGGWNDAMNALPSLLGSSTNESAEVLRLARLMTDIICNSGVESTQRIQLHEELRDFFYQLYELLYRKLDAFEYWDRSCKAKEQYRERIIFGISGQEKDIEVSELLRFLEMLCDRLECGLRKAYDNKTGLYHTYLVNRVTQYEFIRDNKGVLACNKDGYPYVKAIAFEQKPLPHYLEGQVHVIRTMRNREEIGKIYKAVKSSNLYDKKLGMYLTSVDVSKESPELGRQVSYPRGWLENESVFLHMEYKYLLELLKSGLYEEFFHDSKTAFVPFMNPAVYGRSILEHSSFIASSVYSDSKKHGRGYQPRLTGTSAEMLSIWIHMTVGDKIFELDEQGVLLFTLSPILPGWIFTEKPGTYSFDRDMQEIKLDLPANTFAFSLLGSIPVIYHNPQRKNTYGSDGAMIERLVLHDGNEKVEIWGNKVSMPYAMKIRDRKIDLIYAYMG